jgi:hypothetical protein
VAANVSLDLCKCKNEALGGGIVESVSSSGRVFVHMEFIDLGGDAQFLGFLGEPFGLDAFQ